MNRKKLMAFILAICLVLGNHVVLPVSGMYENEGGSNSEFAEAVIRITQQYQTDNVFSSIIMDVDSSVMNVDGEEVETLPAIWDEDTLMLPIVDIAEAMGIDVTVSEETGDMTVFTAEGVTNIHASQGISTFSMPPIHFKSMVSSSFEEGIYTERYNDGSSMSRFPYASVENVTDALNIAVSVNDNKVIITAPYQTMRLIVLMDEGETLHNFYGAADHAYDGNNMYVLQYTTQSGAREACALLQAEPGVRCAAPSAIVKITGDTFTKDEITEEIIDLDDDETDDEDEGTNINDDESIGENEDSTIIDDETSGDEEEAEETTEEETDPDAVLSADPLASFAIQAVTPSLPYGGNWGTSRINADLLKEALSDSAGQVIVAVVDTGADINHEFLKDRLVPGYNFITNSSDPRDGNGHGTHVAGTVVDCTPSGVKVMPIKAMSDDGYGENAVIIAAIAWAIENGADVINLSLGGIELGYDGCVYEEILAKIVESNVVPVVAAGNDALDVDENQVCPAHLEDSITVSATNQNDMLANFSNFGASVDIAAPGVEILSSLPGGSYTWMSGTSMSAPHVAAAAALILLEDSERTAEQVRQLLYDSTIDLGHQGRDDLFGHGVLDFRIHTNQEAVPVTSFELSPTVMNLSLGVENSKGFFRVAIEPFDATNKSYIVTSDKPEVASFENGYVQAVGVGRATLTIQPVSGSFTAYCEVNVEESAYWVDYAAEAYAGGDGSAQSPYEIETAQQLAKLLADIRKGDQFGNLDYPPPTFVRQVSNQKYFKLTADIDLAGKEWMPIGYVSWEFGMNQFVEPFLGHFDGGGHTISNITIGKYKYNVNAGFFACMAYSEIKDLGLVNVDISQGMWNTSAAMVGEAQNSSFTRCYVTGKTQKGSGFAGQVYETSFTDCFSTVDSLEGGFVYNLSAGSVAKNCYAAGKATIRGGFAVVSHTMYEDEYLGFINCFAAGVTPTGGFISERRDIAGDLKNCYFNIEVSNGIQKNYTLAPATLEGKPLSFFKDENSFTTAANWDASSLWDFENVWAIDPAINGGFPYLKNIAAPVEGEASLTGTWLDFASDTYAGGHGTYDSPYQIETAEQLARIAKNYNYSTNGLYFEIISDIDLGGHDWFPIGGGDTLNTAEWDPMLGARFNGNILGNGHTISNVKISGKGVGLGFIGFMVGGTVDNLHLKNVDINGDNYAGGLVGICMYGRITNSSVEGKIVAKSYVGGLIGYTTNVLIKGSSAKVDLKGNVSLGGLIGSNYESVVEHCYAMPTYAENAPAAALMFTNTGIVRDCYAVGVATEGMVGSNFYGKIENSYFVGEETVLYYDSDRNFKPGTEINSNDVFSEWDLAGTWKVDPSVNNGYPTLKNNVPDEIPIDTYWKDYAADGIADGTGTIDDPYMITTAEELAWMIIYYDPNGDSYLKYMPTYFELANDIDAGAHNWYTMGINEFGNASSFPMILDGNGFTIKNLKYKPIENDSFGFFGALGSFTDYGSGVTTKGEIKNLHIEVSGDSMAGLVYENRSGYIHDVSVSGLLINSETLMLLAPIAALNSSVIERCYSDCTLLSNFAGGIVCYNNAYPLVSCKNIIFTI